MAWWAASAEVEAQVNKRNSQFICKTIVKDLFLLNLYFKGKSLADNSCAGVDKLHWSVKGTIRLSCYWPRRPNWVCLSFDIIPHLQGSLLSETFGQCALGPSQIIRQRNNIINNHLHTIHILQPRVPIFQLLLFKMTSTLMRQRSDL